MKSIVVASSKGGVGKTTLTSALAVQATKEGHKVAMVDWEPQGSLTWWWGARGKPANPHLIMGAPDPVRVMQEGGEWDYLFVDTAPSGLDQIARAIDCADFVLIPVHASFFSATAVPPIATYCKAVKVAYAFVVNEYEPARNKLTKDMVGGLEKYGPVLSQMVQNRTAFVTALNNNGRTGPEHRDPAQRKGASEDIGALWKAIETRVSKVKSKV